MKPRLLFCLFAIAVSMVGTSCEAQQGTSNNLVSKPVANANANNAPIAANKNSSVTVAETAKTEPFKKTVELHGIKFVVESPNAKADNSVTITPTGLSVSNEPIVVKVNGDVSDADVGDLNVDQSPEIYVFYRERDGLKRARVVGYSANNKKSLSEISFREPSIEMPEYAGYKGEDEMIVIENVLSHRFPIFDGIGPDAKKTGKTRIVQYKIKPGEATWQFYVFRKDEY